jgi:3-deoxy-D-manno-octulosonic-acid transferase
METEIWPNFLWEAQAQQIPIILVNGRISDRSFARYRMVRDWLPKFSEYWMQTTEDAQRIEELTGDPKRIRVMGNLKFDFEPPAGSPAFLQFLLKWKNSDLLWIAGSTMRGEEEIIIEAFHKVKHHFKVRLLLAPRHPERFEEVAGKLEQRKIEFARRSEAREDSPEVMMLDTIGELASAYSAADLVFIGGSLFPGGGHNPVEAAYYGKPIISGPFYENFRAIYEEFRRRNAVMITDNVENAALELIRNETRRKSMGEAGRKLVQENRGAVDFVLQELRKYLHAGSMVEQNPKSLVR